ncbi:MAG: isocitrate lyase/phosphoenolpyruvate mutase family protein [Ginsengibacter sp.]
MQPENIYPEKGKALFDLHHNGKLLVLPNVWDSLSASIIEKSGYPAVATSSSATALSNGYPDGEKLPFTQLLSVLRNITERVEVPVTADVESAYANNNTTLVENIKRLISTGIAGINFEDSYPGKESLISAYEQCERISLIKKTSSEMGMPLFINARIDLYIKGGSLSQEEKLSQTIERGKAYKEAGADCLFPIFLKDKEDIQTIIKEVKLPVNILLVQDIPDFNGLREAGVARLSLGGNFIKIAINALKNTAEKLLRLDEADDITHTPISSDYTKSLSKK